MEITQEATEIIQTGLDHGGGSVKFWIYFKGRDNRI